VSLFHDLRSRTSFRQYRMRSVPFSYFALPHLFSTVRRASSPVVMFCACVTLFRALRTAARGEAMGCGRRTQRSLLSVHLVNAG
jgi:hypothetical protein